MFPACKSETGENLSRESLSHVLVRWFGGAFLINAQAIPELGTQIRGIVNPLDCGSHAAAVCGEATLPRLSSKTSTFASMACEKQGSGVAAALHGAFEPRPDDTTSL
jgi:hypothetical protein